jgi:hypothetical protein
MVTAADASPDGRQLAILTYDSLWLFEAQEPGQWFAGHGAWLPFWNGGQCESVTFADGALLMGNENRGLYRVHPATLRPLRGMTTAPYRGDDAALSATSTP